jgi:hypothetical protein
MRTFFESDPGVLAVVADVCSVLAVTVLLEGGLTARSVKSLSKDSLSDDDDDEDDDDEADMESTWLLANCLGRIFVADPCLAPPIIAFDDDLVGRAELHPSVVVGRFKKLRAATMQRACIFRNIIFCSIGLLLHI